MVNITLLKQENFHYGMTNDSITDSMTAIIKETSSLIPLYHSDS